MMAATMRVTTEATRLATAPTATATPRYVVVRDGNGERTSHWNLRAALAASDRAARETGAEHAVYTFLVMEHKG